MKLDIRSFTESLEDKEDQMVSQSRRGLLIASFILFAFIITIFSFSPLYGQSNKNDSQKPERSIIMAPEYTGIKIPPNESVDMNITFINRGKRGEEVLVWIDQAPKGWESKLETYQYEVTGLFVPPDKEKRLTFKAIPPDDVKPGKYTFKIKARTEDGKFRMEDTIAIYVEKEEKTGKEEEGVKLDTSYPILRGPIGGEFEFSIEVKNELDDEATFDLFARGPEGWDINFKPAFESKYISSLKLQPNQSQKIDVEVKPPSSAKAGEYPILIRVSSSKARAVANLKIILTGTYKLDVGTPTGILSLEARPGEKSNVSIYVKNTGSAENKDIKFTSFKPENWKVEFKPEKIDLLKPNEFKQVEVIITPYEEALVGDYSVEVRAKGQEGSEDSVEFRVTVKATPIWGWVGIGIIIVIVVGLILIFRFMGRR